MASVRSQLLKLVKIGFSPFMALNSSQEWQKSVLKNSKCKKNIVLLVSAKKYLKNMISIFINFPELKIHKNALGVCF